MAWIKIGKQFILNTNAIKSIEIQKRDNLAYYIKFYSYECSSFSKKFETYEKCLELFDKICDAMMNNKSIDIN